ncbi:MAG: DJ-1/PfpI family protein [Bacteroidales bacterium]|jgi:4-methyl-5(b-hydroxyethyl)-thiazole monophosphate biosynthesis|nr:DJ-1/PfpI family protein [Bacteroidales bacterium]
MKEVLIFLTTGFEEIEALATIDILRRGGVNIKSVSLTGDKTVSGGHRISVIADYLFEEADFAAAQMLIIPGGTVKFNEHDGLKREITAFSRQGKPIAAICAAPMVLGGLGLLRDKRVTCYPGYEKYLSGAHVTEAPVTVDGNITTGRAAGYTLDFALELLNRLAGEEVSVETARKLLAK